MRPNAPVFAKVPGFRPISFEQMGLYANEERSNAPVRAPEFNTLKTPTWITGQSTPRPESK